MFLTSDEQRFLDCLRDYICQNHYSPSIRDLERLLGEKSRSMLQELQKRLQQKGVITWEPGLARSYRILVGNMPLRGFIEAGYLIEHPQDEIEFLNLPDPSYRPQDYALWVSGDSMIDAHICDGDLVIIRPTHDLWALRPNQIAVVLIEGEGTTLKYFHYREEEDWVTLKPANRDYEERILERSRVGLQGILVESRRCYSISNHSRHPNRLRRE